MICSCGSKDKKTVENINPAKGNEPYSKPGKIEYFSAPEVIDLFSEPGSEITNLSDIASDVEYIPLQTSENSLISRIFNVKTNGDIIIIYHAVNFNSELICFDNTGRFLNKLNKTGRGPGEYLFIGDFDINSEADLLVLTSFGNILVYDIKGNEFIFNKSLNFKSDIYSSINRINFIPGQNNILLSYYSNALEPFRNLMINLNGDTLDTRLNYYKYQIIPNEATKRFFTSPYENIIYSYNNSLHFKDWFSDTVFTIGQSNNIIPYFKLDANGIQFTPDDLAKLVSPFNSGNSQIPDVEVRFIMEFPRYIIYNYRYNRETVYEIYDKALNKKIGIEGNAFLKDDISGGINVEPKLSYGNKLYSWVEAITLKNFVSSEKFKNSVVKDPEKKKALETLANSLKETDNPVLIVVTMKQ
jgi:hypothetical protein